MDRVGVFFCTGCDIGASLDAGALEQLAKSCGAVHFESSPCLCAPEGVTSIRKAIDAQTVDGVVIAGCSQRHKIEEFRLDPTVAQVERVALREQVVWTHAPKHEDTQALAEDLLRMGVVRAKKMIPAKRVEDALEETVLVVGGGLAGLQAAQAAADMGHPVVVVERSARLGGWLADVREVVPQVPPQVAPQPTPKVESPVQSKDDGPAVPASGGRFTFNRIDNGFLRLDTQSGEVAYCRAQAAGWACQAVPENRSGLEADVARLQSDMTALKTLKSDIVRLQDEIAAVRREVAALKEPPPADLTPPGKSDDVVIKLPSHEDIARARNFIEKTWHRLVEMITAVQKDMMQKS